MLKIKFISCRRQPIRLNKTFKHNNQFNVYSLCYVITVFGLSISWSNTALIENTNFVLLLKALYITLIGKENTTISKFSLWLLIFKHTHYIKIKMWIIPYIFTFKSIKSLINHIFEVLTILNKNRKL